MDVYFYFLFALSGCGLAMIGEKIERRKDSGNSPRPLPPPLPPAGPTRTSLLTLEYMAPLRTSPSRIQMMEAAGLALSAWQVRLRGSPARRLTTGPPLMTGFSGGTGRTAGGEQEVSRLMTGRRVEQRRQSCA